MRYSYSAFNYLSSVPVNEAGNCVSSFDGVQPCAAGAITHWAFSIYDTTEHNVILTSHLVFDYKRITQCLCFVCFLHV